MLTLDHSLRFGFSNPGLRPFVTPLSRWARWVGQLTTSTVLFLLFRYKAVATKLVASIWPAASGQEVDLFARLSLVGYGANHQLGSTLF